MNWYLKVLKQYADFKGRARRQEFWMFTLFYIIFSIAATILDKILGDEKIIWGLYFLVMLLPLFSVLVRRLHDVGKSGWLLLILLIPFIGAIWIFVLLTIDSNYGSNKYGANPKGYNNPQFEENKINLSEIPNICPHCKNPNTKRLQICEWCGNNIY